jgi:hypothetical protein
MRVAAGARDRFAASADKIPIQSIMDGAGLRTSEVTAITHAGRYLLTAPTITDPDALADKAPRPLQLPGFRQRGGWEIRSLRLERRLL